jgi:undecaprenyl phosphate-alpha-L-ara4N flippase subunit ArnE
MFGLNWSYLLLGFAVFGCGAVLMIFAYRYGELSILQPINSMSYVYALFLGYVFFHEEITFFKAIGVVVIISGILLLSRASTP